MAHAPIEEVYEYVADLGRHGEWAANPLSIQHAEGPANGVGAVFVSRARHAIPHTRKIMDGRVIVTAAEPPDRFEYEARDEGGLYRWTFALTAETEGTTIRHTVERLWGPLPIQVLQPLMWRLFGGHQVRRGVANVAAQLEQSGRSASRPA